MHVDYDIARVDLGADHNGRVESRKVFFDPNTDEPFIVDGSKRKFVILLDKSRNAHVNYVMKGRND